MGATLDWTNVASPIECRVCGFVGTGTHEATIRRTEQGDLLCVRCPTCASVEIQGELDQHYVDSELAIDQAVENGISIESVLDVLSATDTDSVRSFLDVGCNYGFAVDFAAQAFGWHSRGIEPTLAGRRGAAELGVRIDEGYLVASSDLGEKFDLVLASEVLEHVPDPIDFLTGIQNHLSPTGRVLLTTPSAEALTRGHDEREILLALSPGFHQFLASPAGLEMLLRRAGFGSVIVLPRGDNLRAIASPRDEPLNLTVSVLDLDLLEAYYRDRSKTAKPGSALASGMASRYLRSLVNRGAFVEATAARVHALSQIQTRRGIDASDPEGAIAQIAGGSHPPGNLVPVAYCCGMIALLHDGDPALAAHYFELTEAVARAWTGAGAVMDGDTADLLKHAQRSRAQALAQLGDDKVTDLLAEIANDSTTVQAFVAAVTSDQLGLAASLRPAVAEVAPGLTRQAATLGTGLDGLLCLAMLDLQSGSPREARSWLTLARRRLGARDTDAMSERRASDLASNIQAQWVVAETHIAAEPAPIEEPDVPLTPEVPGAISVIMPVYNGEAHIREAMQSVVDQTLQPDELVIIDDGSVDDSIRIIGSIETTFPVRIIAQRNAGQSAARNAGGRLGTGEYLAFIDQDDVWRDDHLQRLHSAISADRSLGWVFSDFDQVDSEGRTITTHFIAETGVQHPKRSLIAAISGDLMALPSASIMRRSAVFAVRGFDPALVGYEDDDLFIRMFRAGYRHAFLAESTIRYRMHPGGSSASPTFLKSRLRFMRKLLSTIPDDHRLNHFFSQDVVVPRFLSATLSDYASAIAAKDYALAGNVARAIRTISEMQGATGVRRRMQLAALDHPRRVRSALLVLERMPRWMRPRVPGALYFGHRSVVRASRFRPTLPGEL